MVKHGYRSLGNDQSYRSVDSTMEFTLKDFKWINYDKKFKRKYLHDSLWRIPVKIFNWNFETFDCNGVNVKFSLQKLPNGRLSIFSIW